MEEYKKKLIVKVVPEVDSEKEKEAEKKLSGLQKFSVGFGDELKKKFGAFDSQKFGKDIATQFQSVVTKSLNDLKGLLKESWEELGNIVSYSTLSNANTRDLAFTYGFNSSQAYGFDKAMSLMGLTSEEDLMYLDKGQTEKFQEYMTKYAEYYTKLYDSGFFEDYREFQYELEDFKQEMMVEVVQFFMDNKDTIKAGMNAIIKLTEFTIQALGWLVNNFGGGTSTRSSSQIAAATNEIINNGGNSTANTTISIDNTFNNVAKSDQSWLANAGQMTYEQILQVI